MENVRKEIIFRINNHIEEYAVSYNGHYSDDFMENAKSKQTTPRQLVVAQSFFDLGLRREPL
jgi:hypothetical protein